MTRDMSRQTHREKRGIAIWKRCCSITKIDTQKHTIPGIEMGEGGKFEEFILGKSKQN